MAIYFDMINFVKVPATWEPQLRVIRCPGKLFSAHSSIFYIVRANIYIIPVNGVLYTVVGMHRILFLPDIRLIKKPDTGYPVMAGYRISGPDIRPDTWLDN
jgi:hypothetical protein